MHYSVLLNECIENLNIKPDGVYVDATMGYAGHSSLILSKLSTGFLYGFDQDPKAVEYSSAKLGSISSSFKIFSTNFSNLKDCLSGELVDGILFDLGFSSPQIDDASRGFSFPALMLKWKKVSDNPASTLFDEASLWAFLNYSGSV